MYYNIDWDISFVTNGQLYRLGVLDSCEITSDVDNLADMAIITLPEAVLNRVLDLEQKVGRHSEVSIRFGYNNDLQDEFMGYVREVVVQDHSLKILCEDELFRFRESVKDRQFKNTSMTELLTYLCTELGNGYTVNCTYDLQYEKFTIYQATAFVVLKKLKEESRGMIYFDMASKTLHCHPPYLEKGGDVIYSLQENVETSSLEWKSGVDRTFEITVESTDQAGNVKQVKAGSSGGDQVNLKVSSMDEASMRRIAESELTRRSGGGYEGSFDAWLIPVCRPTYSAEIRDADYPDKNGRYYVKSVVTSISSSGGKRTVTPSIKLS